MSGAHWPSGSPRVIAARGENSCLGVDAPIIDVRRTVETAAWVRPGAGVPAQRSSASGQQHRQPNDDQRDPIHGEPASLWGSSSPTPPADTISSPGTGPQRRQRLRLGFSTVAVPPFANALAGGGSYRFSGVGDGSRGGSGRSLLRI